VGTQAGCGDDCDQRLDKTAEAAPLASGLVWAQRQGAQTIHGVFSINQSINKQVPGW
jgi:hypothetical protein